MNEFVDAVLRDRQPWVDVAQALNMTVPGIVAHQSALKDGELLKIPQYSSTPKTARTSRPESSGEPKRGAAPTKRSSRCRVLYVLACLGALLTPTLRLNDFSRSGPLFCCRLLAGFRPLRYH